MLDQRGQLLRAAVGFAGCSMPSYDRALHTLHLAARMMSDQRSVRNGPHSLLRRKLRTLYQIDQLMSAAVNGIPVTTLITRKSSTLLRNRAKNRSPVRNKR